MAEDDQRLSYATNMPPKGRPGKVNVNLMSANIVASAATSAADPARQLEKRLSARRPPPTAPDDVCPC
jgi:hypothetical protein